MSIYQIILIIGLLPSLLWGQATIATPSANPRAGLMPISPLRSDTVGGGVRIKDLGFIEGARANQLTGFGVVLGLNNTGDKDTVYSKQALANLLQQYGLTVPATSVSSKNAAAVKCTFTNRVDIFIAGTTSVVDDDTAPFTHIQAVLSRELISGPNSRGKNNDIGLQTAVISKLHA